MTDGLSPTRPSPDDAQHLRHAASRPGVIDAAAAPANAVSNSNDHPRLSFPAGPELPFSISTSNSTPPVPVPAQIQFRSHTIAPSPPLPERPPPPPASACYAGGDPDSTPRSHPHPGPLSTGNSLRILTEATQPPRPTSPARSDSFNAVFGAGPGPGAPPGSGSGSRTGVGLSSSSLQHKTSSSSLRPVSRTPSFKTAIANSIGTVSAASSAVPSPIISAMGDVTPLPSPLLLSDSPGPWKRLGGRPPSREQHPHPPPHMPTIAQDSVLVTSTGESIAAALANASRRKAYASLAPTADGVFSLPPPAERDGTATAGVGQPPQHGRNRSISEYIPDAMLLPKRHTTVSGSHAKMNGPDSAEPHIRRELNLAESRGLTSSITKPPTPPPSESSRDASSDKDAGGIAAVGVAGTGASVASAGKGKTAGSGPRHEYFEAYGRHDGKLRRWWAVKLLGQGTFSRVMLATSQAAAGGGGDYDEDEDVAEPGRKPLSSSPSPRYPHRRTLVAVKVCEHGPRGGASEDRIEMSLKRELEIMQSIRHPSLVHLKAWNVEATRAILVLSYCAGGDLFDVATSHRSVLTGSLLRRMFAELVGAVRYLHERRIVHRDIKLENVLVNIPASELADPSTDWAAYPFSVVTLTDLGLSRRIADGEKLETRCGSDDYAAPEVIMGQPYDGRATDAWSLGVLLYALLEARLPFDPHPGASDAHRLRSRTSHRIARVEWRWIEYAGEDGDHEGNVERFKERGLLGAMEITEGLLKRARSRWGMERVAETQWVRGGIAVEGGVRFHEEEEGEEVL